MDWDANLAAVIKSTDENLAQQFRHFTDLTADLSAAPPDASSMEFAPQMAPPNLATAYFRDSLGASVRPATAASSFADHFRTQQEHKRRGKSSPERRYARDRPPYRSQNNQKQQSSPQQTDEMDYDDTDAYTYPQRRDRVHHLPQQQHMYNSPTYDIAQMMEQIRLSLKLEVDARAAIAERQLSALLQLCKSSTDEMDRLRIELCAADRQLHTIDQVQAKMRQELTTQKDISFHLQSLCGKDESWRIQADNQLLELRQMVAALREHGNAMQVATQDKLSRSELLVQFNAAMEPIKAQFQANLQHQAQQIADITRTSSSSTLMLDALMQKVNRGLTEEVMELRQELRALKSHVGKLTLAQDSTPSVQSQPNPPLPSRDEREIQHEKEARRKEKRQQLLECMETLEGKCLERMKSIMEVRMEAHQTSFQAKLTPLTEQQETIGLQHKKIHEFCEARIAAVSMELDHRLKTVQQHVQDELKAQLRTLKEKSELAIQQQTTAMTAMVEARAGTWQTRSSELQKLVEAEQTERKQALDSAHEALRKCRHDFEDRLHTLLCESRTKWTQQAGQMDNSIQEISQRASEAVEALGRDITVRLEAARMKIHATLDDRDEKLDQKIKQANETIAQLARSMEGVTAQAATKNGVKATTSDPEDSNSGPAAATRERDISKESATTYLSTMDALLHKMQLQLQLQTQAQMAVQASHVAHHNYWPSSPYASMQVPPAPLLLSPPGTPMSGWHSVPPPVLNLSEPVSLSEQKLAVEDNMLPLTTAPSSASIPTIDSVWIPKPSQDEKKPASTPAITEPSALNPKEADASATAPAAAKKEPLPASLTPIASAVASPGSPTAGSEVFDPVLKIQQTINSTAKGAMAEAEMAKSRVENRRRQELEMKQEQTSRAPPLLVSTAAGVAPAVASQPSTPTSAKTEPSSVPARPPIAPPPSTSSGAPPPPPPPHPGLSRSMSTSSIPQQGPESTLKPGMNDGVRSRSTSFSEPRDTSESPANSFPRVEAPPALAAQALGSQSSALNKSPTGEVSVSIPTVASPTQASPAPRQPLRPGIGAASITERSQVPSAAPAATPIAPAPESAAQTTNKLYGSAPTLSGPPSTPPPSHVLCSSCKLPLRAAQLAEHEQNQCIKRLVTCPKCSGRMPWIELESHERGCQSTTSTIDSATGSAASGSGTMKKCRHCAADVLALELFDHELRCDKMLKQCPHCLRRQKAAELQEHIESCDCRLVACPNDCGGKFLQRGIEKHLATRCPKKPMTASSGASPTGQPTEPDRTGSNAVVTASVPSPALSQALTPPSTSAAQAAAPSISTNKPSSTPAEPIECRFCDEEIPAAEADSHEQTCDWKPQRCQYCNMVIISRDLMRHESSCKTSGKSCPHCNESMLQSALPTHTARCSKRPIKCIRCCQLFPADSIVAHSTNCKFIPTSSSGSSAAPASASLATQAKPLTPAVSGAVGYHPVDATRGKVPPPPPYPPTRAAPSPMIKVPDLAAGASGQPVTAMGKIFSQTRPDVEENMADRLARRSLALLQLTNTTSPSSAIGLSATNPTAALSTSFSRSLGSAATGGAGPEHEDDDHDIDDEGDEEDNEDVDEDNMTLAEVVAEWNVENVCLWLHEDVGVPEVVPRFQQRQCNGEMLLDLTESDLINDFGIKNRSHREQILNAIEAIKTSDEFSDEGDDEDDEDDDDEEIDDLGDVDDNDNDASLRMHRQSLLSDESSFVHPRDLLRRNTSPLSPDRSLAGLPSSSAMLRRINTALSMDNSNTPGGLRR